MEARTRLSWFFESTEMIEPWLSPPVTMPLEQSALAREHNVWMALLALAASKMHLERWPMVEQVPKLPLSYSMEAATKPLAAIAFTAPRAHTLVCDSPVPPMCTYTGYLPEAVGSAPRMA